MEFHFVSIGCFSLKLFYRYQKLLYCKISFPEIFFFSAISVVAFFTVIFTFAQPYIAMAVGMPDDIAGSWIGSSVDQTGNVIVSAAIISEEATEVAGIVKMVLNAGLGVMASIVSCYWNSRRNEDDEGKPFRWIMLWDKFPKFTLGEFRSMWALSHALLFPPLVCLQRRLLF